MAGNVDLQLLVNGIASVQYAHRNLRGKYTNSEFESCISKLSEDPKRTDVPDEFAVFFKARFVNAGAVVSAVPFMNISEMESVRSGLHEYDRRKRIFRGYIPFSTEALFLNLAQLAVPTDDIGRMQWLINSKLIRAAYLAQTEDLDDPMSGRMGLFKQTAGVLTTLTGGTETVRVHPEGRVDGYGDNIRTVLGTETFDAINNTINDIAKIAVSPSAGDFGTSDEQNEMIKILANTAAIVSRNDITSPVTPFFAGAAGALSLNLKHYASRHKESKFRINPN